MCHSKLGKKNYVNSIHNHPSENPTEQYEHLKTLEATNTTKEWGDRLDFVFSGSSRR